MFFNNNGFGQMLREPYVLNRNFTNYITVLLGNPVKPLSHESTIMYSNLSFEKYRLQSLRHIEIIERSELLLEPCANTAPNHIYSWPL